MTFWETDIWHAYEVACGEMPGTRAALVASATWQSQVIDLTLPETLLWRNIRHSYKSLIRRHQDDVRHVAPFIAQRFAVDQAAVLHTKKAGHATRPMKTWEMMGRWATTDVGDFWVTRHANPEGEQPVDGYCYVVSFKDWSYYHSSVTLEQDRCHALIWTALRALKVRGQRRFELGWLARPDDTEKDKAISFFKTGFGGLAVPAQEAPRCVW